MTLHDKNSKGASYRRLQVAYGMNARSTGCHASQPAGTQTVLGLGESSLRLYAKGYRVAVYVTLHHQTTKVA